MSTMQPIREPEKIQRMKTYLKEDSERNYMLFLLGTAVGLRISDILQLKKEDVMGKYIHVKEIKTEKMKRVIIPPYARREVKAYIDRLEDHEYLFQSREGVNQPIHRSTAYRLLRRAAEACNVDEFGTHALRKTFGYHFYNQTKDVATLQTLFNHSHPETTLRYIGINQDKLDDAMEKFRL